MTHLSGCTNNCVLRTNKSVQSFKRAFHGTDGFIQITHILLEKLLFRDDVELVPHSNRLLGFRRACTGPAINHPAPKVDEFSGVTQHHQNV